MIMTVIEGEWYNNIKSYGEKNRIDKNRTYFEQPKEAIYLDLDLDIELSIPLAARPALSSW